MEPYEVLTFDEWFERCGLGESRRSAFKVVWNASLSSACNRFYECEGTDHGTQAALRGDMTGWSLHET